VSETAVDVRINAARRAVNDSGAKQRIIKTIPKRGVLLCCEVEILSDTPTVRRTDVDSIRHQVTSG
jgi:DNA-binding winged helix-turn-helix (wHTH) protein